jgi:LysM repeat protein
MRRERKNVFFNKSSLQKILYQRFYKQMKNIESLFILQLIFLVLFNSDLLGQTDLKISYQAENNYFTHLKNQELNYQSKIENQKDFVPFASTLKLSENELRRLDSLYFLKAKIRKLFSEQQYSLLLKNQKSSYESNAKDNIAYSNSSSVYTFYTHLKELRKLDSLYCLYLKESFDEVEYELIATKNNFSDYESSITKLSNPTLKTSKTDKIHTISKLKNDKFSDNSALGSKSESNEESETKENDIVNANTLESAIKNSYDLDSESEPEKEPESKENDIVSAETLENAIRNSYDLDSESESEKEPESKENDMVSAETSESAIRNSYALDSEFESEKEPESKENDIVSAETLGDAKKASYALDSENELKKEPETRENDIVKVEASDGSTKHGSVLDNEHNRTSKKPSIYQEVQANANVAQIKRTRVKYWRTDIPITVEQEKNIAKGFYVVNHGETLYRVSVNTKVSIDKLMALNNLKTANIYEGSKIKIREVSASISESKLPNDIKKGARQKWRTNIPITDEQRKNMAEGFYVVNNGETLYRVSVNTKVSIDKLMTLNRLKTANIYPGTKLKIR